MSTVSEYRKISIPVHRLTPLRNNWMKIYSPIVEHLKLQIRFNTKNRSIELKSTPSTLDLALIQKAADFIKAFSLGFEVDDALALIRMEDIYIDSFEIRDIKTLSGDHLSRAIGRVAGKSGKTKTTIENTSRTRIVIADTKIHILGSYRNIRIAKDAIISLIIGSTPGHIYTKLKSISSRFVEK